MLAPPSSQTPTEPALRHLRYWLYFALATFVLETGMYFAEVFAGNKEARGYVVNSVVKDMLFAALAVAALADLRGRLRLVGFIVFGHAVIVLTLCAALVFGAGDSVFAPPSWIRDLTGYKGEPGLLGWLPVAALFTAVFAVLYVRARRACEGLRVLWPFEAQTIAALAEVTISKPAFPPAEIARAVDARWACFPADRKDRLRSAFVIVGLVPLLSGRAPLPWMRPDRRRAFVEQRLLGKRPRAQLSGLQIAVQAALRFVTQMIYLGYYNDPRGYEGTGYVRFSERERGKTATPEPDPPLQTIAAPSRDAPTLEADYVVIGSGAGGAIVASRLVAGGKRVLLLDRGEYVPPSQVTENEADMYAKLYSDGALQMSSDFTFQVLQGMCVGGGTVINNGICFAPPDAVLGEWQAASGLDPDAVKRAAQEVRTLIGVGTPAKEKVPFSAGALAMTGPPKKGYNGPGLDWKPLETNMKGCLGCGNCNLGCRYGRKLSMTQHVLPDAQRCGPGELRILPLCQVDRILERDGKAELLKCRIREADPYEITIRVREAVVVAAGAIHSSRLLLDSDLGGPRVGRNLSANLATFMTGFFEKPPLADAFDGLQMTHYVDGGLPDGHILETFFNPVMSQSLVMPGWFEEHQENMRRYGELVCVGALVRSELSPRNRVRRRPHWLTGAEFDFRPSDGDMTRLRKGMRVAGAELFARDAAEVMPATFRHRSFKSKEALAQLESIDVAELGARTAHPQGGNGISHGMHDGVVDKHFKVHGMDNVYVADASVFPTPVGVNPQITVMALAHLAGETIVRRAGG